MSNGAQSYDRDNWTTPNIVACVGVLLVLLAIVVGYRLNVRQVELVPYVNAVFVNSEFSGVVGSVEELHGAVRVTVGGYAKELVLRCPEPQFYEHLCWPIDVGDSIEKAAGENVLSVKNSGVWYRAEVPWCTTRTSERGEK